MASEVKFRIVVPGKIFITKAMNEDIFTRYMRGDFMVYQSDFAYYDTPDWDLAENGYLLRVCTSNGSNAATLRTGVVDQAEMPGLYTGNGWLSYFESPETVVEDFLRRGAFRRFGELDKYQTVEEKDEAGNVISTSKVLVTNNGNPGFYKNSLYEFFNI